MSKDNRVICTLWDKHVKAILPYYDCNPLVTVIVLLQLYRAIRKDTGEVKLSSSYDATRVWINHDCPEFDEFKQSIPEPQREAKSVFSMSRFFGCSTFDDLTSNNITPTTISAIYKNNHLGECVVVAKIVGIETGKDWFYSSCMNKKCRKKLSSQNGNFYCATCEKSWPQGILKYKVQLRVYDGVDDVAYLLWDRDCANLLGITAYNLRQKYIESTDLPDEIEKLCGRWLIFKIQVTMEYLENQGNAIPIARDVGSGDEAESPVTVIGNRLSNPDEPQSSPCKRKLLDQFSTTHSLKKANPIVVKKEKN